MTFKEIAAPLIGCKIPVIRLRPNTKIAMDAGWQILATTDPTLVDVWNNETPTANCGAVAKAELGLVWFFEFDSANVADRVYADTNKKLGPTFRVQSSPGRGHLYFAQSPASIAMGNLAQGFVRGGDWSARVHNQYVVAPGSIHPKTGLPYEIKLDVPIQEAPDWFVDWCVSQKLDKKQTIAQFTTGQGTIPEHYRNDVLTSIGGGFRHKGMNADEIFTVLSRINEERCDPPLPESEVRTISNSVGNYVAGDPTATLVFSGGYIAGTNPHVPPRIEGVAATETVVKNGINNSPDVLRTRVKETLTQAIQAIDTNIAEPRIVVLNTMASLRALEHLTPGFPQPLTKKSLWGLMGDFVEIAYPTTVASREMILFQALPAIGVILGKKFYAPFGADRHYGVVWTLNTARTADGKGSVTNIIRSAVSVLDDYVFRYGIKTNISSGEGLARVATGTGMANTMTKLLWVMPEMAMLFNSMHREGSILSHMLREGYDCNPLENEKSDKKKSYTATNYLLGMMGTTSPLELRQTMPAIDWHNGVANRFLWNVGARTKRLRTSRLIPNFTGWAERFRKLQELNNTFPEPQNIVEYSADGLELWNDWIDGLPEEDEDSQYGLSQGRVKPNCLRAAVLYAQLDEERLEGWPLMIEPRHIEAGIEIVTRSAESTAYYLSGGVGKATTVDDGDIRRIHEAIATKTREGGLPELSSYEITRLFRAKTGEQKDQLCLAAGLHLETRDTGGRPAISWCVNNGK